MWRKTGRTGNHHDKLNEPDLESQMMHVSSQIQNQVKRKMHENTNVAIWGDNRDQNQEERDKKG